jgi:hypothetical protein
MSTSHTEKIQELITAYVDGQATYDEIALIEKYSQTDKSIDQAILSEIRIRNLVKHKVQKVAAPDMLRARCLELISSEIQGSMEARPEATITQISSVQSTEKKPDMPYSFNNDVFKWVAAAVLFISVGFWSGRTVSITDSASIASVTYPIEDHVQRHFSLVSDTRISGTTSIDDVNEAHDYLLKHFGMDVTVPKLKNATFAGIELSEFVPGYTTPMLKYNVAGQNDPIIIFAFPLDKMGEDPRLVRDTEAVKTCQKDSDTHIKNVDGKHTVSWKWGNVWYVGVSDHNGEVLASMLPTAN